MHRIELAPPAKMRDWDQSRCIVEVSKMHIEITAQMDTSGENGSHLDWHERLACNLKCLGWFEKFIATPQAASKQYEGIAVLSAINGPGIQGKTLHAVGVGNHPCLQRGPSVGLPEQG